MSSIDEVRQKTDIIEVVGRYVALKKAGRLFRGLCPFHGEKTPSFFVYPEQQSWHCFGCNTGGDAFSFVMKKEGIEFKEALHQLAERAGVTLTPLRPEVADDKKEKDRLYQANEAAAQYFHNLLLNSPAAEKVRAYIAGRGFNAKSQVDFKLGYALNSWEGLKEHLMEQGYSEKEMVTAGLVIESEDKKTHDRFRHKLMFPIMDSRGHVLGFGARVLDDSFPKYVNSPQTPLFDKSGNLYGINLAAPSIRKQDAVVIVEGYVDVIIAHQYGFTNVVASMGTAITERQIGILKKLTRNVVLALDADTAGEEAMLRGVGHENTLEAEVRVVTLPEGNDPDDVIKADTKAWQKLLAEAIPIIDYTFDIVTAKLDLSTPRGKSAAAEQLLPIVGQIKNGVRQAHYLQKLARLVNVSERTLEAAFSRTKPEAQKRRTAAPPTIAQALRPHVSSPVEELCLTLLLQHPELKASVADLSSEYFENSEHREIFLAWQQVDDITSLKERLDASIHDQLDSLSQKDLPPAPADKKLANCVLRMKERYLRNLEARKSEVLALEAETGGSDAELAKLKEQGIETSVRLSEIFAKKVKRE